MKLSNYITLDSILFDLEVSSKNELLQKMAKAIANSSSALKSKFSAQEILQAVLSREEIQTTDIGMGITFPHARIPSYCGISICIATLKNPIQTVFIDNNPITIACMAVIPECRPAYGVKILSTVSKIFASNLKDGTVKFNSKQDLYDKLLASDFIFDHSIKASEIMRKPRIVVNPNSFICTATRAMAEENITSAAVTDENGKLIGELNSDKLFKIGIPEFFTQLKTVSFIKEFDPFEKYFAKEADLYVKDIMDVPKNVLPPTATIMEVVFDITVKKYEKIYIVDNEKLIGVIDKILVLEKIINL